MKKILSFLLVLLSIHVHGQVQKVSLQASGLTCSMCSNSINKALKSIDYVDKVMANIKNSTFDITFKPDAKVKFDDLKKKVEDAGFSVANLSAIVAFDNASVKKDDHVQIGEMLFHFINVNEQVLNGTMSVTVLDKGYVSAKDFKKNMKLTAMECYKTGTSAACCPKTVSAPGTRVYHISI